MIRKNGYYWIKRDNNTNDSVTEDGWEVAYYDYKEGWVSIWDGGAFKDSELIEINENMITPEEKESDEKLDFNWGYFRNYVATYSPTEHAGNHTNVILHDMIYGLGVAVNPTEYRWGKGYKCFKKWLIEFLKD
ncbi:MAG: hypothetical protein ACOCVF_01065 [bacterium]